MGPNAVAQQQTTRLAAGKERDPFRSLLLSLLSSSPFTEGEREKKESMCKRYLSESPSRKAAMAARAP